MQISMVLIQICQHPQINSMFCTKKMRLFITFGIVKVVLSGYDYRCYNKKDGISAVPKN